MAIMTRLMTMMSKPKKYTMSYEPASKDGKYCEPEWCVWHDKEGKEVFRVKWQTISNFRVVMGAPDEIQQEIIFWTGMLHNPD